MSILLPFHNAILEKIHDPGSSEFVLLARGLGLRRIVCKLLQIYDSPQSLVILVNATPEEEAAYIGFYSIIISLIYLSGGNIKEAKLQQRLKRLGVHETVPQLGKTEKLLLRVIKDAYIVRIKENINNDEEEVTYYLGPRAKVEIGPDGVRRMVKMVFGARSAANGGGGTRAAVAAGQRAGAKDKDAFADTGTGSGTGTAVNARGGAKALPTITNMKTVSQPQSRLTAEKRLKSVTYQQSSTHLVLIRTTVAPSFPTISSTN